MYCWGKEVPISEMIGQTFVSVENRDDEKLIFSLANGTQYIFEHFQDCCEQVSIEEVVGDLSDLVGSPLVEAEEVDGYTGPSPGGCAESYTWTFYKFGTAKGHVTVRWLGESNGYYGEGVDLRKKLPE